jgi:hypothetical protein
MDTTIIHTQSGPGLLVKGQAIIQLHLILGTVNSGYHFKSGAGVEELRGIFVNHSNVSYLSLTINPRTQAYDLGSFLRHRLP